MATFVVVKGMTGELKIGNSYRIAIRNGEHTAWVEGEVRSLDLPRGVLGNRDGRHPIWVTGRQFDWFLRADEVESAEELTHWAAEDLPSRSYCRPCFAGRLMPRDVVGLPRTVAGEERPPSG